jgi:hypothetical protein
MADFLIDKMQKEDGSFYPIYEPNEGSFFEANDKWSNQSGSFHTKIALGLVDMNKVTSDKRYKESAIKVCEYALSKQESTGRFITDKNTGTTNLHPHCYSAEGLWYAGIHLDIPEFRESAKKATVWAFSKLTKNGLNELYNPSKDSFNDLQRSDVLAQALRLGIIFSMPEDKIGMLRDCLLKYQALDRDKRESGGFYYGMDKTCVNSWCSMFALQALWMYDNRGFARESFLLT